MSPTKIMIASFVAASAFALTATANASETPSLSNCLKMERQVKDAIDANQQSASITQAKAEARAGREFCTTGLYKSGITHYASALKLIGADKGAAASGPHSTID
jgi:hypothetical protein